MSATCVQTWPLDLNMFTPLSAKPPSLHTEYLLINMDLALMSLRLGVMGVPWGCKLHEAALAPFYILTLAL